jgi:hypothetical protein
MVADISGNKVAELARDGFRFVVAEAQKLMEVMKDTFKGLAGVVGAGVNMVASVAPSAPSIPAVAAGPPGAGRSI